MPAAARALCVSIVVEPNETAATAGIIVTIHRHLIVAGALAVAGLLTPQAALALRCDGEIVSEDAPAYVILKTCGPPDHITRLYDPGHGDKGAELWYYDLGYGRLLRELKIRDGRLQQIRTLNADIPPAEAVDSCQPTQITTGMTSYELLARCGAPAQREKRYERHGIWRDGRLYGYRDMWVEVWYYAFDTTYIDRRVEIVNGRVESVDTVD